MRILFAYIRVSTPKQGERGVSLQEQRDAIVRYAERNGLEIREWFEERETAAKRGRPVFTRMLRLLRQGKAAGVVIHKIDRGARNLKDWADLGELIDQGVDVHFANESLDLHSRGGRLSADIQAVVAADYIRNLREETRKGFYGRLKQGMYPLPAPLGYIDQGRGKAKELDPVRAPLVKVAFELYASGRYNLGGLLAELARRGLRNRRGGRLTRNGLSVMLNNPFYVGLIRLRRTGETFSGVHDPLISPSVFDRVQLVLRGKTNTRARVHEFPFRRILRCGLCGYSLNGEAQKGHTYYRCHTPDCATKCVREDAIERELIRDFRQLELGDDEWSHLRERLPQLTAEWAKEQDAGTKALSLQIDQLRDRLGRLTDAFIDGSIEKALFEERKATILTERARVEEELQNLRQGGRQLPERLAEFLELAGSAYSKYENGLPAERRELVEIITSNRQVTGRTIVFTLRQPFRRLAERFKTSNGSPYRDVLRTWDELLPKLWGWVARNPATVLASHSSDSDEDRKRLKRAA